MTEIAQSIDLNLAEKLRDRDYRQKFFIAEASASIARQLIALRKRRGLDQAALAQMVGTQQPAISRVEKADYQNWSFNTLRKIAAALDARISIVIKPSEDVLSEYESQSGLPLATTLNYDNLLETLIAQQSDFPASQTGELTNSNAFLTTDDLIPTDVGTHRYSLYGYATSQLAKPRQTMHNRDRIITELRAEVAHLRDAILGKVRLPDSSGPAVNKSSNRATPQTSDSPLSVPKT